MKKIVSLAAGMAMLQAMFTSPAGPSWNQRNGRSGRSVGRHRTRNAGACKGYRLQRATGHNSLQQFDELMSKALAFAQDPSTYNARRLVESYEAARYDRSHKPRKWIMELHTVAVDHISPF